MKKTLIALIFICLLPTSAQAYTFAEAWTWQDTTLEGIFIVEAIVDLGQSLDKIDTTHENNPLLPRHPSREQFWGACIVGTSVHALISMVLPPHYKVFGYDIHPRLVWQSVSIGLEGANIIRNASIGLHLAF